MKPQSNENNIPKHWQVKKLGEVCQTTSGGTPSRGNKSYYEGTIPWVKSGELDRGLILDTEEKISEEAVKYSSAKVFPKGTLLIALYGATIGKLAFLGVDAATNQAVCGIYKNENIDSNYLYHFLFSKKPSLVKQGIGGAQPNISQGILKNLDIPIPPLSEQLAIVSKIEELLSDLENGKQQLLTAQQQLKVYRQSLLKAAFEGKLTNVKTVECELPKHWRMSTIGDVFEVFIGSTPKRNNSNYWGGNINWLSSGEIAFCNIKSTKEKITTEGLENTSCKIHPIGTVIIAMIGEGKTRGQAAILKVASSHNQNTAAIRVNNKIYKSELLYYYLVLKYEDNRRVGSGNNQKALNKERVKGIPIPIPPLKEQELIVDNLESKLTVCDKIEETIKVALLKSESLRQSILKKAFEGKLL